MKQGLTKAAKVLTDIQIQTLIRFVEDQTNFKDRNRVVVLLSFRAGLRAKEIGCLTWSMVTDAEGVLGDSIALENSASKGKRGGRVIPMHKDLREALALLYSEARDKAGFSLDDFVVTLRKKASAPATRANSIVFLFRDWYSRLGFRGASSHSGRRTFITKAARKVSQVGGSLRDVQSLAGHSSIALTQRYVDCDPQAQRKLIDIL